MHEEIKPIPKEVIPFDFKISIPHNMTKQFHTTTLNIRKILKLNSTITSLELVLFDYTVRGGLIAKKFSL